MPGETTQQGAAGAQGAGAAAGGAATQQTIPPGQQPGTQDPNAGKPAATVQQEAKPGEQPKKEGEGILAKPTENAELEIKLADGNEVHPDVLGGFKAVAKEHGLSAKQAQAMADFFMGPKLREIAEKTVVERRTKDVEALKADKDFGGTNFDKTVTDARTALGHFGGEKLAKKLVAHGLDNDPDIVIAFAKAAKAISQDSIEGAKGKQPEEKSEDAQGRAMFPNSWDKMKELHKRPA